MQANSKGITKFECLKISVEWSGESFINQKWLRNQHEPFIQDSLKILHYDWVL